MKVLGLYKQVTVVRSELWRELACSQEQGKAAVEVWRRGGEHYFEMRLKKEDRAEGIVEP